MSFGNFSHFDLEQIRHYKQAFQNDLNFLDGSSAPSGMGLSFEDKFGQAKKKKNNHVRDLLPTSANVKFLSQSKQMMLKL